MKITSILLSFFILSISTSCKKFDGKNFKERIGYGISIYGTSTSGSYSDFSVNNSSWNTTSNSDCPTVQCSANTIEGDRCERMTTNCSGLCWQH
jgi:hypothetical protein